MKATAIKVDVKEISKLEKAVPEVAILTATIKFTLTGDLSILADKSIPDKKKEVLLGNMLAEALRDFKI